MRQNKERRAVNAPVVKEKRATRQRRSCPECGGKVSSIVGKVKGGTVTTQFCERCSWKHITRAVDRALAEALAETRAQIQEREGGLVVVLPARMVRNAHLKAGSTLVFSPVVNEGPRPKVAGWRMRVKRGMN